jgi:preprotein translocase subunit YajC
MESLGGMLFPLLILLLFIPIFLSGRKQRRQMHQMQQLQASLDVGDVVTTTSGLRGTVVDASYEDTVDLEIADGVVTTWLRASVRDKVLASGTDAAETTPASTEPAAVDGPAAPAPATGTAPNAPATGTAPNGTTSSGARADNLAEPTDTPSDANGSPRP